MRGLKGKNVVVTGAGGGIGAAICRRFGAEGCTVGLFDLNEDAAKEAATATEAAGGKAHAYRADITDYDAVTKAVARFESDAGAIDVLVNNAGWDKFAAFLETDPALWDKVIAINLRGPINMHHAVLKGMAERRSGKVINISSDAGRVGSSGEAVYSACKGGIIAMTKTLAREMARNGVTLNAICPGPTDTPLFHSFVGEGEAGRKIHAALEKSIPLRRLGQPDDMPGMVAFLASDDASYITGQVISISGGLTMSG